MRKINDNLIFSLSIAMLFTACGGRSSQTDENQSVTGIDSAWVHVTQTQFDAMGMQLDTIREVSFSEKLRVNGYILSSVNGQAQVTSRLSGSIRHIFFEPGDFAAAGSTLCTIERQRFSGIATKFYRYQCPVSGGTSGIRASVRSLCRHHHFEKGVYGS